MKKDIRIPVVKGVYVAVIKEWDEELLGQHWNAYVINDSDTAIEMVLVVSKGYDEVKKTSLLRRVLGEIEPKSCAKIEMIQEELLAMNNEFSISYFIGNTMYDKKYVFEKDTIHENALKNIPVMNVEGILRQ